jgi:hypothetical protein
MYLNCRSLTYRKILNDNEESGYDNDDLPIRLFI